MARVELPVTVISSAGVPVAGAAIDVSYRSTGAPAPWWSSETGGTSSTGAVVTDDYGRASAWLERGAYNLSVTGTGITPYTEPWDAIPASDNTLDIALIPDNSIPLSKLVASIQQTLVPTGTVLPFAGSTAPTGYLMCDGSTGNRVTHAELFTLIGTTYGAGDGSTTFGLPNLRGRVPVGRDSSDSMFNTLGEVGGEKTHLLTSSESGIAVHTHSDTFAIASAGSHAHSLGGHFPKSAGAWTYVGATSPGNTLAFAPVVASVVADATLTADAGSHSHTLSGAVANSGAASADSPHNTVQPFQVINYIIKY